MIKRSGDKLVTEVPNPGDLNIVGIEVKEDDSSRSQPRSRATRFQLPGKRTGNEMGGKWSAGGFSGSTGQPRRNKPNSNEK